LGEMRFLVIGAHPDDIELVCGGTMAKYANFAHKIVIATMTNGDKGPLIIPPKRLAKIRQQEARRAASLLSGQHVWGDSAMEMSFMIENVPRGLPW